MKPVYMLESFEDIEKAFFGVRTPDDLVPIASEKDRLVIGGEWMRIESKQFVLSESMQQQGKQFVMHCIEKAIGKHFDAHAAFK